MYHEFSRLNRSRFRAYPRKTPERTDDRIDRAIDRTTDRTTDGASRRVVDRDPSVATSVRRDVRSGCSDASRSTPPRTISRSFSVAAWLARTVSPDPGCGFSNRERGCDARRTKLEETGRRRRARPRCGEEKPRRSIDRFHRRANANRERTRPVSTHFGSSAIIIVLVEFPSSNRVVRSVRFRPRARLACASAPHPSSRVHPRRRARSSSSSRAFLVVVAFVVVVVVASSILVVARTWARVFIVVWVRRSRRDVPRDRPGGARPAKRVATNPRPGFLGVGGGGCVYRF